MIDRLRTGIESMARWIVVGAILGWIALTILGAVDIVATAKLISAMKSGASQLAHRV
jgi:hypothetical protein